MRFSLSRRRLGLTMGAFAALAAGQRPLSAAPGASRFLKNLTVYGEARYSKMLAQNCLLLSDGAEVVMTGLNMPQSAPIDWADHLPQKSLIYAGSGRQYDRYGRVLAHVFAGRSAWLQGIALSAGRARVETFADNRALAAEMLDVERKARLARRGMWRRREWEILQHDDFNRLLRGPEGQRQDGFRIVDGRIVKVAKTRRYLYFNYGQDYRQDFTLVADRAAQRLFERENFNAASLEGRLVRVRGWVSYWNGPAMKVTHPQQIEVLDQ